MGGGGCERGEGMTLGNGWNKVMGRKGSSRQGEREGIRGGLVER